MSQERVETIEQAYAAFGRGDIPAVMAMLADDVEWSVPDAVPHGREARGHDEVGAFFAGIAELWSDFGIDVVDVVDGGDRVIGLGRAYGKLGGQESGYGFVHVFTFADGVVTRFDEYVAPPAGGFPVG